MSYTPDYPPQPTASWPTQEAPTQVQGWGVPPTETYGPGPQGMAPMGPPPAPKSSPGLVIVLVLLAVAALGLGAFFLVGGDDDDETADRTNTGSQTTEQPQNDDSVVDDSPVTTLPDVDVTVPTLPDTSDSLPTEDDRPPIDVVAASAGPPSTPPTGDAQFDDLADSCYQGDMQACDDLYLQSPLGSDFEAYGDTCGARVPDAAGYYCTDLLPDPELPAD